ncbi:hypothetical protein KEM54_004620 [Ascosphaera aggregata]|nr:hypothetical protein KEM54_004620 [Ascosphaera aggregata]
MAFQAPAHPQRSPFISDLHQSRSLRANQPTDIRHPPLDGSPAAAIAAPAIAAAPAAATATAATADNNDADGDETDEWVLFSPTDQTDHSLSIIDENPKVQKRSSEISTIRTCLTHHHHHYHHHSLTVESDSDSWSDPLVGSIPLEEDMPEEGQEEEEEEKGEEEELEGDTELDSLDDGLHAFNEPLVLRPSMLASDKSNHNFQQIHDQKSLLSPSLPLPQQKQQQQQLNHPIFPAHDGRGSFIPSNLRHAQRIPSTPSLIAQQQQQLLNITSKVTTKRHSGPSSIIQRKIDRDAPPIDQVEFNDFNIAPPPAKDDPQRDRWQRIEDWRMEQGRALLAEIQKEIKRQKQLERRQDPKAVSWEQLRDPANHQQQGQRHRVVENDNCDAAAAASGSGTHGEPAWHRVTRRIVNDIIGIDDDLLAILFDDSFLKSLVEEGENSDDAYYASLGTTRTNRSYVNDLEASNRKRMLDHVAKELGVLVHHFYEEDHRAFSTYTKHDKCDTAPIGSTSVGKARGQPDVTSRASGNNITSRGTGLPFTSYNLSTPTDIHVMSIAPPPPPLPPPDLSFTLNREESNSQNSHDNCIRYEEALSQSANHKDGHDQGEHEFWEQKLNLAVDLRVSFSTERKRRRKQLESALLGSGL